MGGIVKEGEKQQRPIELHLPQQFCLVVRTRVCRIVGELFEPDFSIESCDDYHQAVWMRIDDNLSLDIEALEAKWCPHRLDIAIKMKPTSPNEKK